MKEDYSKTSSRARLFAVNRSYRIKLREPERVQALYDDVVEAGANSVSGPIYQTSELRKYRDQARALALTAAREKALAMAQQLGVVLGSVRTIREVSERSFMPFVANVQVQRQETSGGGGGDDSAPLGQIEVSADMEVVFDLANK